MERIVTEVMEAHRQAPAEDLITAFLRHPNLHDDFEIAQSILLLMTVGATRAPARGSRKFSD